MSRFVSDKKIKVVLPKQSGDELEEWVEIRTKFGFEEIVDINESSPTKSQVSTALLGLAVTGWNLKDEDGNDVPLSVENIRKLDVQTVTVLMKQIEGLSNLKEFSSTGDSEADKKKLSDSTAS